MKYLSVCSGIEAASVACSKCGKSRASEGLRRSAQRKHGHIDWCMGCYAIHAHKIRNGCVASSTKRRWNLSSRYDLTTEDVDRMIADQGGKCAICRCELPSRYHIDHCHQTGRVRGVLCHGCNLKLPLAEDADLLASALRYLGKAL